MTNNELVEILISKGVKVNGSYLNDEQIESDNRAAPSTLVADSR